MSSRRPASLCPRSPVVASRVAARSALLVVVLAAWLASCSDERDAAREPGRSGARPNVLIVIADDLSRNAIGAYGGPEGSTPHLDRLAERAAVFERAMVASPFCTPSRQAFLTGRWPHAIGVTQLATPLPDGLRTLGRVFGEAGYATAAFGKMHWQRRMHPERRHGFEQIADVDEWLAQLSDDEREAYEAHRELWRKRNEPGWSRLNLDRVPLELPEGRHYAAWVVDRALEFADTENADGEGARPFLAFASLRETHVPFTFPASFADRVRPEDVSLPAFDAEALARNVPFIHRTKERQYRRNGVLGDEELRRAVASYRCAVAWVDAQVGRLLDGLEARGLAENTLVVFWSDHGYFMGEHGLTGKNFPYREILDAPLMLAGPGVPGGRTDALVQSIDVYPTLCELAGLAVPDGRDGRSFAPLLRGDAAGRERVFSEFGGMWACVRSDRWKLVLGRDSQLGMDQLYDLRADPGETENLVRDPQQGGVVLELTEVLAVELRRSPPDGPRSRGWMSARTPMEAVRDAIARVEPKATGSGTDDE